MLLVAIQDQCLKALGHSVRGRVLGCKACGKIGVLKRRRLYKALVHCGKEHHRVGWKSHRKLANNSKP